MKNNNVIQKIGFALVVIGIIAKYLDLGKVLGGGINDTLSYASLISFSGIIIWVIGYIMSERQKKNDIKKNSKKE